MGWVFTFAVHEPRGLAQGGLLARLHLLAEEKPRADRPAHANADGETGRAKEDDGSGGSPSWWSRYGRRAHHLRTRGACANYRTAAWRY